MIELIKPRKLTHWLALRRLYREAFPAVERKPEWMILKQYRMGRMDIWCAMEKGRFSGMVITINSPDVILLDYLAVVKKYRGTGVGTGILEQFKQKYAGKGLFLEIENPYDSNPEQALRQRRKAFYLRNGFVPMGVMVYLFGVEMELLGIDCRLDFRQYHDFYRDHYSPWAADHITRSVYPEV